MEDKKSNITIRLPESALEIFRARAAKSGEAVFDGNDVAALANKSASAVEFVAQKSMALSGLAGDAVDEAGKAS